MSSVLKKKILDRENFSWKDRWTRESGLCELQRTLYFYGAGIGGEHMTVSRKKSIKLTVTGVSCMTSRTVAKFSALCAHTWIICLNSPRYILRHVKSAFTMDASIALDKWFDLWISDKHPNTLHIYTTKKAKQIMHASQIRKYY